MFSWKQVREERGKHAKQISASLVSGAVQHLFVPRLTPLPAALATIDWWTVARTLASYLVLQPLQRDATLVVESGKAMSHLTKLLCTHVDSSDALPEGLFMSSTLTDIAGHV